MKTKKLFSKVTAWAVTFALMVMFIPPFSLTVSAAEPDTTPPTAEVNYNNNGWKSFLNIITFGRFFKDKVDVKIRGKDDLSGVAKVEYYKSPTAVTPATITGWQDITASAGNTIFSVTVTEVFYLYIRVTDNAGNVSIFNNSVVVYADSDKIANGTFYKNTTNDLTVAVEMHGNTVDKITGNGISPINYTTGANSVIFEAAYLDNLTASATPYEFEVTYKPLDMNYIDDSASDKINEPPNTTTIKITVSLAAQSTLSITDPGVKTYGDSPFNLTTGGTGSGSGAVTYALDETSVPAANQAGTVSSGGLVTITKAGTIYVTATKAADSYYSAATANLTITVLACPHTNTTPTTTPATCTKAGKTDTVCDHCHETVSTVTIPIAPHSWSAWTLESGITFKRECTVCGQTETADIEDDDPMCTHTFNGTGTITNPATCSLEGEEKIECDNLCGAYIIQSIPRLPHMPSGTLTTPATCTANGKNYTECTVCGEELSATVITALGHNPKTANCTQCDNCAAALARTCSQSDPCAFHYKDDDVNPNPNPNPRPRPTPTPTPPEPKPEPEPLIKKADINGDGKVTPSDALIVLKFVVSIKNPTAAEIELYDMNGDGRITPRDALIILKLALAQGSVPVTQGGVPAAVPPEVSGERVKKEKRG